MLPNPDSSLASSSPDHNSDSDIDAKIPSISETSLKPTTELQPVLDRIVARLGSVRPVDFWEARYPLRNLPNNAEVTRVAPSPTGYMHIGGVYMALINYIIAKQSGGVFFLRIEDTDIKRTIPGALETITKALESFGIAPDETPSANDKVLDMGNYGPYLQSARQEIYRSFAAKLLERGAAYPCFAAESEIDQIRNQQTAQKLIPGYYEEFAIWRDAPPEKVADQLSKGAPFVIRLRSPGNSNSTCYWKDGIKGEMKMPENNQDIVLIKSDGLPTYHFAHVVDDHLMRTTNVIRGDEWISSVPVHLQLFNVLGWVPPRYSHCSPIQKIELKKEFDPTLQKDIDVSSRRKLSKRKDPEANVRFYDEQGFPRDAIIEYLLNLANSTFEDWRKSNVGVDWRKFELKISRFPSGGALSDLLKLTNISQSFISQMPLEKLYAEAVTWAESYDPELSSLMKQDPAFSMKTLGADRTAKRIKTFLDLREQTGKFYDEIFKVIPFPEWPSNISIEDRNTILQRTAGTIDVDDRDQWFNQVKGIAGDLGFALKTEEYKADPSRYKGLLADVASIIRLALWKNKTSPDIFQMIKILGSEQTLLRLQPVKD